MVTEGTRKRYERVVFFVIRRRENGGGGRGGASCFVSQVNEVVHGEREWTSERVTSGWNGTSTPHHERDLLYLLGEALFLVVGEEGTRRSVTNGTPSPLLGQRRGNESYQEVG